jgi:nicotinamide-nucleotide adenylyltransferase
MERIGVIHGRFQVLHNDHLTYLLAGKERCEHLIVGITSPDPLRAAVDDTDPERSMPEANPLTYYERQIMVRAALTEAGIELAHFTIVPLPINMPELFDHYVPRDALYFLTIYDNWGRKKLSTFRELGLRTEIMWERPIDKKGIRGSEVRRRIAAGQPWEHLVPRSVARIVTERHIPERLRALQRP